VVLLGYGWLRLPFSWLFVWLSSYVLVAVILCAMVGGALGVFGADPLNPDAPRRGSIAQLYTFMLLAGAIGAGGIYVAPGNWHRMVILIVVGFLVYGLWEKVRERLPYLLDPGARPRSRIMLADGLAAALLFFVLQILYLFFVLKRLGIAPSGPWIALGFVVSGVLSVSLVLAARWKAKTVRLKQDLGLTVGRGWKIVMGQAALCGVIAIALGLCYLYLLGHWPWLHRIALQSMKEEVDLLDARWGLVLAVVAAPFVEELIFRGMIFKSLRRNHGVMISVIASSILFAVVHDPLSVPPVFVLGCAAAIAFERSGSIWSGMMVHGAYNAAIAMGQSLVGN
jgi:membrane protease YdiL (CAAX protease family)